MTAVPSKPLLSGMKVLELASVLAGPSAGMFLAELGATVIKVENLTTQGDVTRKWKLPEEDSGTDISGYFSCVNWGKLSIAIDICTPEGLNIIRRLAAICDIILVSYKPGDAEKLGVDYVSLKRYNESIIYAHITGYGVKNPRAGFDAIIQAESGFTYINGQKDGPPTKMPVALMDVLAAHHLKEALLIALLHKGKTGQGQYIEASLFKAGVASLANQATNWLVGQTIPQRMGSDHPNIVPYGTIYRTKDHKEIVLAAGTDNQFAKLVIALGKQDLAEDKRFATNQHRVMNKKEINKIIQELIIQYDRDEILKLLAEERIPAGGVFNMQEVFEVPEAEDMLLSGKYPDDRQIQGVRSIAFESTGSFTHKSPNPPPHYGEHTHEVLKRMLNMSDETIKQHIDKEVVYAKKK